MKKTIAQGIEINMCTWGHLKNGIVCSVCLAGSVMLQTEKIEFSSLQIEHAMPENNNKEAYVFLDEIRKGRLRCAFYELDISYTLEIINDFEKKFYPWQHYQQGKEEAFYTQLEQLIQFFKKHKL